MSPWMLLLAVGLVRSQETTTEDFIVTESSNYTVTYNPGQNCLPYDGSVVPDCSKFVDPITKQPYYHEHSTNCSRFWECGPEGETCLVECANCQHEENGNAQCEGRWALVFDVSYQYPDGPVCDWPGNVDCSNVVCDEMDPRPECCSDEDCVCPGAYCTTSFTCSDNDCEPPECSVNSDCDKYDGHCNIPAPHTEDKCQFCDEGDCNPGCSSSDLNCEYPAPICDLSDHTCKCNDDDDCNSGDKCDTSSGLCVPDVCEDHPDCTGFNATCNVAHDNCFYCGAEDCPSQADGCCEGCHMDSNCAHPSPICDMADHRCKCLEDSDCEAGEKCDNGLCVPGGCQEDSECPDPDAVCNEAHDNCFYCGGADCEDSTRDFMSILEGCCPGCAADANCAYPRPVCSSDHLCGCENNADCEPEDYCNTESNSCEPACVTDKDCNPGEEGECDVSTNIYTNCHYCDTSASPNECKPGCKNDHSETDPIVPYCPAGSPDCNVETHECSAESGSVLLKRIVVKTSSCESCSDSDEGITLQLTGLQDYIKCNTNNLNHADKTDFSPSQNGEFFTETDDKVDDGWGACYESALKGQVNAAVVSWVGSGTWTVDSICFDWSDADVNVWVCSGDGSSLTAYQEMPLTCEELESRTCP